ncbi:hypothetical protein L1I30_05150 [Gillisia sp. M10.2A]|uniref:Uncharacterized protein n=1 Tax=Gillisia lutea TaxID=2909668 RepID=A0ABS9EDT9_9FLAO|nr:hypothetical protein [Gillisia lutea]MCF4101042.1 hypothetical protein [Gillisia lutea]
MKLRKLLHYIKDRQYCYGLDFDSPEYFNPMLTGIRYEGQIEAAQEFYQDEQYKLLREHFYLYYKMEIISKLSDIQLEEEQDILGNLGIFKDSEGKRIYLNESINEIRSQYNENNWNILLSKERFYEEIFTDKCFETLVINIYGGWDVEFEKSIDGIDLNDFGLVHENILNALIDATEELELLVKILFRLKILNEELEEILNYQNQNKFKKEPISLNQSFIFSKDHNENSIPDSTKRAKCSNANSLTTNQKILLLQELGGLKSIEGENSINAQAEIISKLIDKNQDNVRDYLKKLDQPYNQQNLQMKKDIKLIKEITSKLLFN